MIDHVALHVRDFGASKSFYDRVLPAIGYEPILTYEQAAGYGNRGRPYFWIVGSEPAGGPTHVAFQCEERKSVEFFHAAAVAAGGTDNGGPGLREHYHPTYYAAYVLDPDGNNVEAVCHT